MVRFSALLKDLVIWLVKTINLTTAGEHRVAVSILPNRK